MIRMRAFARLCALALVAGTPACVTVDELENDQAARTLFASPEMAAEGRRLVPWTTLKGYLEAAKGGTGIAFRMLTGISAQTAFVQPIGVSVLEDRVYVVDAGTNALYRFDWQIEGHDDPDHLIEAHDGLTHPSLERLTFLEDIEEPVDVYVSDREEIFIADAEGSKVVRYDQSGRQLQVFKSEEYLNRPVAVTVDKRNVRVFVADAYFDQVLVFNMEGEPLYRIGQRGDGAGQFRNIRDMVQGRGGLYIIDGFNRRIQLYGLDGTHLGTLAEEQFNDGKGIAIDDEGRLFISDRFENKIHVLDRYGQLLESIGTRGRSAGQFDAPSNIWYSDGYLYVADTNNKRVQVLWVMSEAALEAAPSAPAAGSGAGEVGK